MKYSLRTVFLLIAMGLPSPCCMYAKIKRQSKARRFVKRALPGAAIGGLTTGLLWGGKWSPVGIVVGGLGSAAIASALSDDNENEEH